MLKVKPILYMLGKGGISVLQTAIFYRATQLKFNIKNTEILLQKISKAIKYETRADSCSSFRRLSCSFQDKNSSRLSLLLSIALMLLDAFNSRRK